jgi:sec-independent protein translocase protein TatB
VFDLDFWKLAVLAIVALVVFGPERLPGMAAQVGRGLRELRKLADGARSELQDNLGPEFSQFDIADLNPKHFVRKHLIDEVTGDGGLLGKIGDNGSGGNGSGSNGSGGNGTALASRMESRVVLAPGESPPYDADAT